MKVTQFDLQADVTNTYDKTKTTRAGLVAQKTINTEQVLGPPLTKFIDLFVDSGGTVTPSGTMFASANNRLYVLGTVASASTALACYDFDLATGAYTYRGRILLSFPNSATTTHTIRFLRVVDSNTSNIKVYIGTVGSVTVNGGVFLANKVLLTDFTTGPSPVQLTFGIASDAKAMYMLQEPSFQGAANNLTTIMGGAYNATGNEILVTNGTAASFNHQGFSTTTAPNVDIQTTTAATSSGSPTFTLTGHGYNLNDQVYLIANAPTGFTVTTTLTQTVYFINNPTANTFELKATVAGASINATSITASTQVVRAFGQSNNAQIPARKTGTIVSGFAGTALLIDSQKAVGVMYDGPNAGQPVYFFSTTTNFYNYLLSDITTGVTALPSSAGINNLGTGTDITAPTSLQANYSEFMGVTIYNSAIFSLLMKRWVNSSLFGVFGGQVNTWLEGSAAPTQYFRGNIISGLDTRSGWVFVSLTTAGQRGILAGYLGADTRLDTSYVISPVKFIGQSTAGFISTIEQLYDLTDTTVISYRTATTFADPIFNTASGGWTVVSSAEDLSSIALQNYVQIKINYDVISLLAGTPSQIQEINLGYTPINEISSNWTGSVDNTTGNSISPAYSAFRLAQAYASTVPTLYFRAYDDSNTLVASANTLANPTLFKYSTDNGTSWLPLGTIPNVINTTELRYEWASPPGVRVTVSIRES